MRQERLTLYKIDLKYIRNLAKVDDRVMSISPQINKCMRPFVGIVIVCNDKRYCKNGRGVDHDGIQDFE